MGRRQRGIRRGPMSISWLHTPAPKAPGQIDRTRPLAETLSLIPVLRRRFGITRIGDTTALDRIGIPTFCAVVADSPDVISIYNGKGLTREHSICSAVMEAVERQCGATIDLPFVPAVPRGVDDIGFAEMGMLPSAYDRPIDFVSGVELVTGRTVEVPYAAVRSPWHGDRVFLMSSSSGLASGNTILEAVYHALMEYVERHGWAVAHTLAHVRPRIALEAFARAIGEEFDSTAMIDDPAVLSVSLPTGDPIIDRLLDLVECAELSLRLMTIPVGDLPTVMMASINEADSPLPMSHFGLGASWSPRQAAVRAITEAAQTRSVDIQGAREDLLRAEEDSEIFAHHGRRRAKAPHGRWYYDAPLPTCAFSSLPDRSQQCLAAEVRDLLIALVNVGIRRVIVVDLSPANLPVSVVRVLVPDMETSIVDGHIGPTARALLSN